jgi:ornithine cyclodeaminase/alanine dehydrogenase-like protein (mu-crystallin family)
VLVLTADQIARVMPLEDALAVLRRAFVAFAQGQADTPQRTVLPLPRGSAVCMPAWLATTGDLGVKVLTAYPGNDAVGLPVNQAVVVLFDADSGRPAAVLDGTWITAVRTGVTAALGADALARGDATVLAVLGSGPVASWALRAVCEIRPIASVRIWSRRPARAQRLLAQLEPALRDRARLAPSAVEAAREADIVVTATSARAPLLDAGDVAPGAHVSSVGAVELGSRLLAGARVVVDSLPSCLAEAEDLITAGTEISAELGAVLSGRQAGRTSRDQVTVFKSTGLAFQDVALGGEIVRRWQVHPRSTR